MYQARIKNVKYQYDKYVVVVTNGTGLWLLDLLPDDSGLIAVGFNAAGQVRDMAKQNIIQTHES